MIQKRWATLSPEERMALMDQLVANLGSYSTNARVATIGIINSLLSGDFSPNEFASIQARLACHEKVDNVSTSLSGIEAILGILTVIDGLGRSGGLVPSGATYNGPRATVVMMKTTARLEAQEIARLQQDIRALYREKADGRIEATGPVSAGCVEQQAQVDPTAAPRSGVSPSRADRRPAIITGSGAR
jgi:hypothetical protein